MEIIIVAAIVLVLCYCMGMTVELLALIFLGMLDFLMLFIFGFFVYSFVRLCRSKKTTARFSKIDKSEKAPFKTAFYKIDGEEHPNALPAELIAKRLFYSQIKDVKVYLSGNGEVFDLNAVITVALGLILGAAGFIVLLMQILSFINL